MTVTSLSHSAATSVDRIDRVSRKYSLLTNVDKTKVMASDGIACRILIQVELVELHRGQGQMEKVRPRCGQHSGIEDG